MFKHLIDRLTYANVVATLALFISLGGVSYAAITLPAGSVGAKQLRAGAVGLGALGFPLGTVGITDNKVEDLTGMCAPPSNVVPPILPLHGGPTPGREIHVFFRTPGRLLLSAIVGLKDESASQKPVPIELELIIDRRRVTDNLITTTGGQIVQAPIQTLADVSAGSHTAGLAVRAENCLSSPGHVLVSGVSVIASALPGLTQNETQSGRR
jgi:hypothetical protein